MNTMTQARAGGATRKAATHAHGNSPVTYFEDQVKRVWESDTDLHAKATKLYRLSDLIQGYIKTAQQQLASTLVAEDYNWNSLCCHRAIAYLNELAVDTRKLAIQCQRNSAGAHR